MSTVDASRPKVLRKLVIDEFSFVDAPASVGSDVLVWKSASGSADRRPAGPDHRAEIRKAVAEDDFAELDRLVRQPDGGRQYQELLMAGELVEAVERAAAKRARAAAG